MEKFKAKVAPGHFTEKYTYVFVIGVALVCTALMELLNFVAFKIGDSENITYFFGALALSKIIVSVLLTVLVFKLCLVSKKDFGARGLWKGLLFGLPLLVFLSLVGDILTLLTSGKPYENATLLTICLFLLKNFMIGYYEEVLCRGFMLNALRNKYGDRGLLWAVLLSSFIFGLMHLIGVFGGAALVPTISQAIYATFIGVFFCGVYIRVGNLWSVIIIHALIDVTVFFSDIFTMGESVTDVAVESAQATSALAEFLSPPAVVLPFALYGLFLIRKQLKGGKPQ